MTGMPLREDNHYVSCGYLKRWASSAGGIWTYRILVSHPQVPLWKECFPKEVAYHRHLYTRVVAGQATDEIERWLDSEFETPAEEALGKQPLTHDSRRTTGSDWSTSSRRRMCGLQDGSRSKSDAGMQTSRVSLKRPCVIRSECWKRPRSSGNHFRGRNR
jgi:hypothetical protein